MANVRITKFAGLHTDPNENSSLPEGALWVADNIVIRKQNVISPRRGQDAVGTLAQSIRELYAYGSDTAYLLANSNSLIAKVAVSNAAATYYTGAAVPPDTGMRLKAAQAKDCIYFATAAGVKVLESLTSTAIALAGVGRAPDAWLNGVTSSADGFAWASAASRVAYQIVWGYKDANGRYIWGAPSGRTYATTTATPAYVTLGVPPISATGSDRIFRVYRTESTLLNTDEPSEDLSLVYENKGVNAITAVAGKLTHTLVDDYVNVNATAHGFRTGDWVNISPGEANFPALTTIPPSVGYQVVVVDANNFKYRDGNTVTASNLSTQTISVIGHQVIDYMSEDLFGDPLYTSATTGDGALQANYQPPMCKDLAWWQSRMFYANTTSKHRFYLTMLGCSAPEGVQDGDLIVIDGLTYTAKTTASAVAHFQISTSTSPGIKTEQTARNLVKAINANPSNTTITAYYISGATDNPGQILLEERGIGGAAFSVYISASTPAHAGGTDARAAFAPFLTLGSTSALTSTNDANVSRVYYSKLDQPEAVPLLNYFDVGAKSQAIRRIVPLRDRLYVFKDDGIFMVSGDAPFRVDLLDDTVQLMFADTPATVENQIYCVTRKGVCAVSEAGVAIVSRPIESLVVERQAVWGQFNKGVFGRSYESEHSYMLFIGHPGVQDTVGCLVYNTLTNTWVNWTTGRAAAVVDPRTDLFYSVGHPAVDDTRLYVERKSIPSVSDYIDDTWASAGTVGGTIASTTDAAGRVFVTCKLTPSTQPSPSEPGIGDVVTTATFSGRVRSFVPYSRPYLPAGSNVGGANTQSTSPQSAVLERLSGTLPSAAQSYDITKAINCAIGFAPQAAGAIDQVKQFTEVQATFRKRRAYEVEVEFSSDASRTITTAYSLLGDPLARTTTLPDGHYYVEPLAPLNRRIPVPIAKQRAQHLMARLNVGDTYLNFELTGFTFVCDGIDSFKGSK